MAVFESSLRRYREQSGWTQGQLAQMVGVSRQTIANIEACRHEPGVLLGTALAAVLRVPVHELFRPVQMAEGQVRRYRFLAAPQAAWRAYMTTPFNPSGLIGSIPGALLRGLVELPNWQGFDIEIQMDRRTHEEALDEIDASLGHFGLRLAEGYIVEVATAALESALAAGASGGLIGSGTKNAGAALAGALLGLAVGAAVGSQIEHVVAAYSVRRAYPSQPWELVPITVRQRGSAEGQTG